MTLNRKFLRSYLALAATCTAMCLAHAPAHAFNPRAGDFSKPAGAVIRVLSWNVHNNFIQNAARDGNYERVIKAVAPDIIAFQEMDHALTEAQIAARLTSYFPGSTWYVHRGKADGDADGVSNRNAIASRFPLSMERTDTNPTSDIRGVAIAMVDLPNATYARDLYFMSVHFKAGTLEVEHQKRQKHADAIINWMRDARTAGGNVNIPSGTPMMVAGDFNLVKVGDMQPYHASKTLQDGTIYNTGTFGASSPPDWDGTDNGDASPYDYNTGLPWTHGSADPKSRIDRIYFTDSVIHCIGGFVLNSRTMTQAARNAAGGILTNDTSGATDHMPVISDFKFGPDPNPPGQLVINEYNANNPGTDAYNFLEIKNVGGRPINMKGPVDYYLKQSDPLTASVPSAENEQYEFDLVGVVPPGGLFVLYSGAGHSSAIAADIESRLPALNRQNLSSFVLDNDNDSAIALVTRRMTNGNRYAETLVEAYGWGAPNPGETKYFRLDANNNPVLALGPNQWTSFYANMAASYQTVSRNPNNAVLNSYAGWTIGAGATPGLENQPGESDVNDWMVY